MKQGIFRILGNERIADATFRITLEGDTSDIFRAGQFADVALEGRFLRRPLAVTEWDDSSMSLIYKVVGEGTAQMSAMRPGESLDVLTGLGNGFDTAACSQDALVVCGGLGASPIFSLVKELRRQGRNVTVVMGFNKASEIILEEPLRGAGASVHIATMDGSVGFKGLVTGLISELDPVYDCFYTCGPKVMMKAVCELLPGHGQVSLEERMGCGCGICYGCTCHTTEGPRRICADGPVFDREVVIW